MTARPIVDGLQNQYANRVRIVRVDLLTPTGRELADRYGFRLTPFFAGFDASGKTAWTQTGLTPTPDKIDQLLKAN
jgi:hypothetical protein